MLIHLVRPNPGWPRLETAAEVRLAVIADWRARRERS